MSAPAHPGLPRAQCVSQLRSRLTAALQAECGKRLAFAAAGISLLLLVLSPALQARPMPRRHVVLVVCDALTSDDLQDNRYPMLRRLAESGAVGLMNTAVAGPKTPTSALMAIALGEQQPALPSDEQAYQISETVQDERGSAGQAFARRTGITPPRNRQIVHLGIASLTRRGLMDHTLGAILAGDEIPVRVVICGNADTDGPGRRAALLAVDDRGLGTGDLTLSRLAPGRPFGKEDIDLDTLARYAAEANADLFVAQVGDTARLEAARRGMAPSVYRAERERALHRLNAFLILLQAHLAEDAPRTDVLLVSPYPPLDSGLIWSRLTPVVAVGPDFARGLFVSPTTRTVGLVANIDIAPTLLSLFRISPSSMVGRPMRVVHGFSGPQRLAMLARMDYVATLNARAVTRVLIPLGGTCFLLGLAGLFARRRWGTRISRRFAPALVYAQNLPAALLLAPLLVPPTLLEYGLRIAAWMAALTLLCYLLGRPLRIAPPLVAALICILLVIGDTLLGQYRVKESLLSSYALSGIRFYGIGNEYLGVLIGMALAGAFAWLDDRQIPLPQGASFSRSALCLILIWSLLTLVLGWPSLGANAGSLIVSLAGFGVGSAVLRGRRPTPLMVVGWMAAGLLLSFLFGVLDAKLAGPEGSSHAGAALGAAAHGRGVGYLAQIAVRKLAMNLRLLFAPYLLLGAGVVAATVLMARALIGAEIRALLERRVWTARSLPALLAASTASLLFKDSGVVTVTFLIGSATTMILWYVFTDQGDQFRPAG